MLVGRPSPAEWAADVFRRQLRTLREANTGKPVVNTFFEISAKPLMTVNRDHVISEMISLCGGRNVFGDAAGLVSEPSREELLARGPQAILFGRSSGETKHAGKSVYEGLPAARAGRVYGITADYALRPGPRLLLAAAEICDALDRSRASMKARATR
jgi:ABC-type Fe3+-hydroxamate transport system substrate-binding protein